MILEAAPCEFFCATFRKRLWQCVRVHSLCAFFVCVFDMFGTLTFCDWIGCVTAPTVKGSAPEEFALERFCVFIQK